MRLIANHHHKTVVYKDVRAHIPAHDVQYEPLENDQVLYDGLLNVRYGDNQGRRGRGARGGHGPSYRQDPSENWKFDILSEFEFLRSSFSLYYAILIYEREIYFSTM